MQNHGDNGYAPEDVQPLISHIPSCECLRFNAVRKILVKEGTANSVFPEEENSAFPEGRRDSFYLPGIPFSGSGELGSRPKVCRTIRSRRCEAGS